MKTNLSNIMNWDQMKWKSEGQIAVWAMSQLLSCVAYNDDTETFSFEKFILDDVTKFYATTLMTWLLELHWKKYKTHQEYKIMLDYLKEIDWIIWIKAKTWFRFAPAENIEFEDDLSG